MARVLVVDDAAFMRKMVTDALTKGGHEVIGEAGNGAEAVERWQELRPDLTTLDITMPEKDGLAALKEIISIDPSAKVIMCSALGQESKVLESIKLGAKEVGDRVIDSVWGFFATYVAVFVILLLLLMALGLDQVTAFSALGACISNLGPGLGQVAVNYAEVGAAAKWILAVAMIMGRLEIFTLLVLFTPAFWRR